MSVRNSLLKNIRIEREVSLESSHGTCRHDRLQTLCRTYYTISGTQNLRPLMIHETCSSIVIKEEAQKELVEYLKKTMSSMYDLVEEDFIHETSLSPLKHEIVRVLPFNFIVHEISYLVGLFFLRYSLSVFKPK